MTLMSHINLAYWAHKGKSMILMSYIFHRRLYLIIYYCFFGAVAKTRGW